MASFGFSISDIILISNYAYSVYKSCKNAGKNFREITADIDSLRHLLITLDNECKNPQSSFQHLSPAQEGALAARLQDCKADLRSVKTILHKFRSLDTRDAQYRDKLAFTSGQQAAIREKITTHGARIQQLLAGLNVATFSRIERNTEAHCLSLLELHAKLDKIQREISSGRRNAVAVDDTDEAVALEDEILEDNMTDADVDVSYEVYEWIDQVARHDRPSADKHRHFKRLFTADDDASLVSVDSLPLADHLDAVANRSTAALVTHNGRRLKTFSDSDLLKAPLVCQPYTEYSFYEPTKRWVRALNWSTIFRRLLNTAHSTFYVLDFSLEELYVGTSRRVDVRRRILRPKGSKTATFEEFSFDVKIRRGYLENDTIRYREAGDQYKGYTESLVFVLNLKNHKVFGVLRVNLTHVIYISIVEASEGWRREIRHPSGNMIEIYANGPTNIGHFLEMKGYGLLNRKKTPISHGNLLLWVQVKDVDEVSVEQLDNLNLRGGAYYARIKEWGDQPFQSTKNEPYFLFLYGAPAVEHGKLLEAGTR